MKIQFLAALLVFSAVPFALVTRAATSGSTTGGSTLNVAPGETRSNGDVSVRNSSDSNGKATIRNVQVDGNPESEVRLASGFHGSVTGLDGGDTVTTGNGVVARIEGTGGTVEVGSGSTVTVTVSTSDPTGSVTVQLNNGASVTVPAGSTAVIHT